MLRRIEMIDLPAKRRLLHKYRAAASFFVQINRQKPSQQPSRKKSNTLPSTGSHRRLHKVISHRWMFCLGQVPTQASQAMHSPLRRLVSSSFRHTGHCCLQALHPGLQCLQAAVPGVPEAGGKQPAQRGVHRL